MCFRSRFSVSISHFRCYGLRGHGSRIAASCFGRGVLFIVACLAPLAAVSQSVSSEYFVVQVGAFANPRPEVLQSLGAYGAVTIEPKDELSRVLVGKFVAKTDARALLGKLRTAGYKDAFIRQVSRVAGASFLALGDTVSAVSQPAAAGAGVNKTTPLSSKKLELISLAVFSQYEVDAASALQNCISDAKLQLPRVNNKRCTLPHDAPTLTTQREPTLAPDKVVLRAYGESMVPVSASIPAIETQFIDQPVNSYRNELSQARMQSIPRPRPEDYVAAVPMPDRWRLLEGLGVLNKWYDPYNQNVLKADFPIKDDWFFNITGISDTVAEARTIPTPVGLQSTRGAGSNDVFGSYTQSAIIQNVALEFVYYQGDTVFKPVDWEFRFTPVFNINHTRVDEILAVNADPGEGAVRTRTDVGIQSAFVDKHWRNVSDNYDFDSVRVGIQPFSSDFRGFLFQDSPFGVRLFGNRANNKLQYNIAWFRRLDKDINSGLNDVEAGLREDDLFIANLYWQDQPTLGFTPEILLAYNRNRETDVVFDANNFITRPASIGLERPRTYDVFYLGLGGDGHFGRLNLTSMFYWVTGKEQGSVFAGVDSDVDAMFFAAEPSIDFDWARFKLSLLYASGDRDPYDDRSEAFDAIFENPIFAGADTSYWVRQAVPLIGGGRVALSSRNGLLNSMRSSKEQGQSNFTNPGLLLLGGGVDLDLMPQLRLSFNANYLQFAETAVLEYARATGDIDNEIGLDVSAALIWRPYMTQNIVARLSYARLFAGRGFVDLYGNEDPYSILANVVLTW